MVIQEKARILKHDQVGPNRFKLTVSSNYLSKEGFPGQFINVRVTAGTDPLLRRPFGLHRIIPESKLIEILYEVVGKGTRLMTEMEVNNELDILGPLGNGFKINKNKKITLLVAGGMGVAPLLALAEELKGKGTRDQGLAIYVLLGAKTMDTVLCEKDFKALGCQVLTATDDGSYGKKGFVSNILIDVLNNTIPESDYDSTIVYACGPKEMLRTIAELTVQKKIDCLVSMETYMGCGFGTCNGCVIETTAGYKKVCEDGPVFEAKEIVW